MLADELVQEEQRRAAPPFPYQDSLLRRDKNARNSFYARLVSCGIMGVCPAKSKKSSVSPFFVTKKGNRQRVVWDCRIANTHFRLPPKPDMGSAEALQRLEMPEGQRLFEAEADVKDCFYQCGLPGEYSAYFCVDDKTDPPTCESPRALFGLFRAPDR